jgi:outer membrane protein assembly factor BamE (lipoprotein component of BamABCDE complex)
MMRILPFLLLSVLLSGCLNAHKVRVDQGVLIEPETLQYLQAGLTQDQVRKLFGPPANVSSFNSQRWEYMFKSSDEGFQKDKVKQLIVMFDARGYVTHWTKQ